MESQQAKLSENTLKYQLLSLMESRKPLLKKSMEFVVLTHTTTLTEELNIFMVNIADGVITVTNLASPKTVASKAKISN